MWGKDVEPMVSVVIPAFNCEKTILQAISSVLHQTVTSVEIIVVDDGSTDQTFEIVRRFASTENTIRLHQNPQNFGVAETRNIGCRNARGNYIAFLDSDDIWETDKLEKQLKALEWTKCDFSYTSYYITSENGKRLYRVPATISYSSLLKENVIGCSTVMLRAEVMKEHVFNSSFFHEDYALWLTLLREGYQAIGIEEALVCYRKGGRSANKLKAAKNRWRIYREAEQISFLQSCRYMLYYICRGLAKYS